MSVFVVLATGWTKYCGKSRKSLRAETAEFQPATAILPHELFTCKPILWQLFWLSYLVVRVEKLEYK